MGLVAILHHVVEDECRHIRGDGSYCPGISFVESDGVGSLRDRSITKYIPPQLALCSVREQQFSASHLCILSQMGFGARSRRFPRLLVEPSLWSRIQSWKKHDRLWSPQSVQRPVGIGYCYKHPDFSPCSYLAQWFIIFCNYNNFLVRTLDLKVRNTFPKHLDWSTYDREMVSNYTVQRWTDGSVELAPNILI